MTSHPLLVVAALLPDSQGRLLLAQRPPGKPLSGLWEFPGGKIEPAESPEKALRRELNEELGIEISEEDLKPFSFVSHDLGERHLIMLLYVCRRWRNVPSGKEGQDLAWVAVAELESYAMPEPDRPLLPLLRAFFTGAG